MYRQQTFSSDYQSYGYRPDAQPFQQTWKRRSLPMCNLLSVAAHTGPLSQLSGQRVLVLADAENLIYSARNLGYGIAFDRLADRLRTSSRSVELHAFISTPDNRKDPRLDVLRNAGWIIHTNPIHTVKTSQGTKVRANSDNFLLFTAGQLLNHQQPGTVIIGSGDGDLSDDLARAVSQLNVRPRVLTLSLAGSTAQRLNSAHNPRIAGNIEVGQDCLGHPVLAGEGI